MSQSGSPEFPYSVPVSHAAIQGSPETTARMLKIFESLAYTPDEVACLLGFGTSADLIGRAPELSPEEVEQRTSDVSLELDFLDAADRWTVLEMAKNKQPYIEADIEGIFSQFDSEERDDD